MWWLDPGKEVLNVLFNRILAPYVENLDLNQVNYGIGQGQITLRNLRLKKGALDKFQLPVDVQEGYLGKFTLSLHWMNLGNQPVEILVEDVYLLVVPSPANTNPEEEEQRAQAAKAERLQNAELLHVKGQAESSSEASQPQGLWDSLVAKIINNVQVTVKNVHIRYEDNISVPGHPFAAGLSIAAFTAISVNDKWQATFIESTAGVIHKLAKLESLAIYFDTDAPSASGMSTQEVTSKILHSDSHQYILKPVSGEGRVVVNHITSRHTPRFDVQLIFDEISVAVDNAQYRDVISLVDMYQVYRRQHQYRKYRPSEGEFSTNPARARLLFAGRCILANVHERNEKWTWKYFSGRRDDRNRYVDLFQKKVVYPQAFVGSEKDALDALEKKLSYEDIRFYRSIARSRLKKDDVLRQRLEAEKNRQQPQKQSWGSWLWGSSDNTKSNEATPFTGTMTDEQRKQLYDVLDYDEKTALAESLKAPRDSQKMRITAKLRKGSLALKTDPHGAAKDMMLLVFDVFQAAFIQRPDNVEASISLDGFRVFDGTTPDTLYPQIVHVKSRADLPEDKSLGENGIDEDSNSPFFFVRFEQNPLDQRADNALTVRLRHMEVIYHKGYVEAIYKFFRPPASQLESVEALLSAASQTLEGLRKETRAGLEYALQTHKTIDLQMDMDAPVIIIPENVSTNDCKHLIIDAGHIAIESNLVNKEAIRTIQQKRNQVYNEDDYKRLESLMYDKLVLRLKDAQFIIGDNLLACREALSSGSEDSLHLMERINVELQVEKSIVPTALNISQFRVSGKLPSLQVNFSDTKYKSLMRLVDVCIPKFENPRLNNTHIHGNNVEFQLPPSIFGSTGTEYNIEDDQTVDVDDEAGDEQFFEAEDGPETPGIQQHNFDLYFEVSNLRASISKTAGDGTDKVLGDVCLERFSLQLSLTDYEMEVLTKLRSIEMNVINPGTDNTAFISCPTATSAEDDLLSVTYRRVQNESPDFLGKYEGFEQTIDARISTLVFRAAPQPVLSIYDFIMSTFSSDSGSIHVHEENTIQQSPSNGGPSQAQQSKTRIVVNLESIQVMLISEKTILGTLSLSTADVYIVLHKNSIRVGGRLGSLALTNNNRLHVVREEFNQILSIEGSNFADFLYESHASEDNNRDSVQSSFSLNAASVKVHFLEQPFHDIYLFVMRFAKLKGIYDAATEAAVQTASAMNLLHYKITIKTPILVFPCEPATSTDSLIMRLGEIEAHNSPEPRINKITASLRGIQLVSDLHASPLKIIDDIDLMTDIIQTNAINRDEDREYPDTRVIVKISDVRLQLTQVQYAILMILLQSISRAFAGQVDPNDSLPSDLKDATNYSRVGDAQGEVQLSADTNHTISDSNHKTWTSMDLVMTVDTVKLHLYDDSVLLETQLKEHGIARFALNDNTLRLKILSDGALEAQVILRSFTMSNTKPGNNKFREIIPAARHDRNQFMLLYTSTSGPSGSSMAVLTVDSPHIIFAVDPIFSLLQFFSGTSPQTLPSSETHSTVNDAIDSRSSALHFRIDLHDVSISVLENDADAESQAIRLYIDQLCVTQQEVFALSVNHLGMSLLKMGKDAESVRFLDDLDFSATLDQRYSASQQTTSIEMTSKTIIIRASYRDIMLITSITEKAIALYGSSTSASSRNSMEPKVDTGPISIPSKAGGGEDHGVSSSKAQIMMSKEQFKGSFDGFRLILIGDLHEQPMLHLRVKPFILGAKDWSGQLHSTTTMATQITYWNLLNSHWEPLIDPWTFTITATREDPTAAMSVGVTARERLDLNLSSAFMELGANMFHTWSKEGKNVLQKARGTYAPYRIKNRTGSPIFVWSDTDSAINATDAEAVKISNNQIIDWRFDDWKTTREHVSSSQQHNIGIQFVGKSWEQLRTIPVDREGEFIFSLRPITDKYPSKMLCEVKVVDSTKIVTLRSTYKVTNYTLYPLELMIVDDAGQPVYSLEKIVPGEDFPLPIEAVTRNRIRIQPDQGFGYKWCPPIRWEDLVARKSFTIRCPHTDANEAAFRFQAWAHMDINDSRKYPRIDLKLRAPLELENLLPYNLEYRIFDKNTNQNWRSYLRKGGVMPVHSIELGHFVLLNVTVQDTVFKPSDFAIINTDGNSDFDVENKLTLRDQLNRKLDLKMDYVRHPDSGGAFKLQIYSHYIIMNRTGLPFSVKATRSSRAGSYDVAGDTRSDALSSTTPFLLSHPSENGHEYLFKVGDSAWSKLVSVEAPVAETELAIPSERQKNDEVVVGLSWSEGLGKYKMSKIITISPRFLIRNLLTEPIAFREHGGTPRERNVVSPGQRFPLYIMRSGGRKLLTIAFPGLNAQWSPAINIEDIGVVHFRLRRVTAEGGQQSILIRADVRLQGSSVFIILRDAEDVWPFEIENDSDYVFKLCQKDTSHELQSPDGAGIGYTLKAHSTLKYAWDNPSAYDRKIMLIIGQSIRVIDIMEIGNLIPFKFVHERRSKAVSLDVRAEGQKQVLRITNYNPESSVYKPKQRSNSLSSNRYDTISSNTEAFEAVQEDIAADLIISVEFAGIGISLINKRLTEVIYVTIGTLKFEYTNSAVAQAINMSCGTLQIDNQLHDAVYPVVLQPTPIPKESTGLAALPTVQGSVIWLKDNEHGVLFVKYCSILLQALTLEADEDLLFSLYDLVQVKGISWEDDPEDILIREHDEIPDPAGDAEGQELYFEVLELQPIRLSLSFMRTERVSSEEKLSIRNPLAVVLNAFTMAVGNINDAPLELNALGIKDVRLTTAELQSRVIYHYRQDVLRQLYRILGSADFIGNPVGLFTNVSSGVADIFYEPFQGVVMHGNRELGIGIAKGAASFVKKTVFGVSDSVTKFTSSLGKGLSAATFDSEYQARRRMTQRRNKPRHAIYGVAAGGEAFASSVTSAVEGVLMKPLEGAESEGALGFFKGMGKGLVGAVTKPVVGVFDLASNVSEGIRNTTTVFDSPERDRVRLPRLVPADGALRSYSAREALGQYWMKDLNNGAYRSEFYIAHINSPGGDNVILLTSARVISFWSRKLRLDWELPFSQVQGVTIEDTGIRFTHKAGKENDKFAFIPDKSSQSWFFGQVATVVKSYNAKRRMDS